METPRYDPRPCFTCGIVEEKHSNDVDTSKAWSVGNHLYMPPEPPEVAEAQAVLDAAQEMIEDSLQGMSVELIQALIVLPSYTLYPLLEEHLEARRNAAAV